MIPSAPLGKYLFSGRFIICLVFFALGASLSAPGIARAQPAAPRGAPTSNEAERLFQEATKYYNLGQFELALERYERAYKTLPLPAMLFNIGQCHRNLKNYDKAIFTFEVYLKSVTEEGTREQIEKLLAELHAQSTAAKLAPPPPPPLPVVTTKVGLHKRWWFWVLLGVGAAAVAGGVTVGVAASDTVDLPSGMDGTVRYF